MDFGRKHGDYMNRQNLGRKFDDSSLDPALLESMQLTVTRENIEAVRRTVVAKAIRRLNIFKAPDHSQIPFTTVTKDGDHTLFVRDDLINPRLDLPADIQIVLDSLGEEFYDRDGNIITQ